MAFLVKALFRWNEYSKNADISVLSNFLAIFFSISRTFTKYYLHAKFQINWTIQTEISEGGRICPPPSIPICKKPGLFRVKLFLKRGSGYRTIDILLHSSLNLVFRQSKLRKIFIFGMAYSNTSRLLSWSSLKWI